MASPPLASPWRQVPAFIAERPPEHIRDLDYRGKLILAPMVRCGTLPMRLLALDHGADIVYSPETIDRRLARSRRVENKISNTIDFVDMDDGTLNLRLHAEEKSRLVVQIGSSDPTNAVLAAAKVAKDCAGIDLNCGCPKKFSVVSAMGAALLSNPDRLCEILTALVESIPLPITAKIRMLETQEETIALAQRIEKTGISALALHCRLRSERPQNPGHWEIFEPVARALKIPLIANGDIFSLADVEKLKQVAPTVSSFMLARAPESNFSIFGGTPMSPTRAIIEYTKCAIQHDSHFHNCKYVLMQMWPASQRKPAKKNNQSTIPPPGISSDDPSLPPIHNLAKAKSFRDLCGFVPELTPVLEKYELLRDQRRRALEEHSTLATSGVENAGPETELGPECPYLPKQEIMLVVDRDRDGRVVDGESLDSEQRKRRKSSVE